MALVACYQGVSRRTAFRYLAPVLEPTRSGPARTTTETGRRRRPPPLTGTGRSNPRLCPDAGAVSRYPRTVAVNQRTGDDPGAGGGTAEVLAELTAIPGVNRMRRDSLRMSGRGSPPPIEELSPCARGDGDGPRSSPWNPKPCCQQARPLRRPSGSMAPRQVWIRRPAMFGSTV